MSLEIEKNGNLVDLNIYYQRQQSQQSYEGDCNDSTDTKWWSFTPYDLEETKYYIKKLLVLPGLITVIVIVMFFMGFYENPIIGIMSIILTYIGSLLLTIYTREQRRKSRFEIPENDVLTPTPPPLNKLEETKFRIGFVGDIMMMRKYKLTFHEKVKKFFNKVDIIVGNFEGIVTKQDPPLSKQAHPENPEKILKQLQDLLGSNTKWLLCLSNNHSIDFGSKEFHKSLHKIRREPKIDVFGRNDVTNVFVKGKNINISTASEWSNQKTWDCISRFRNNEIDSYYSQNKFNIFYPHWGYENERYVRSNIQNNAKELLISNTANKLDLIFGCHPHVRQPIMKVRDEFIDQHGNNIELWKLVAFSGGNFTSGVTFLRKKKHIHGIIMKCDIGPLKNYPNQ